MDKNKDLAVTGNFIDKFHKQTNEALTAFLGDPQKVVKFVSSMRMCFASNPKLKNCTTESLTTVFMNCAEWGLYPSHVTGECYVIPYKDEATFQLGYQGMIVLAYRAGVKHIDSQIIYKNDEFEVEYGMNQKLIHKPDKLSDNRGEPIGAYAVATLDSGVQKFEVLGKADIMKHRAKSQSYKGSPKFSPWNPDNDPQLIMWRKTALKQLFKFLPKSPVIQAAISQDTKSDIIDMTPDGSLASDMDVQAFVNEANEFLESVKMNKDGWAAHINHALIEVTGKDSFEGITSDQLEKVKKLVFTGEMPARGEGEEGKLDV